MSRACRVFPAVLALFGALSSAPVGAQPVAVQPFLVTERGALLPGELDWLLALEGGRYRVVDRALVDQKSGDQDPRLDEPRVRALLKTRSAERVAGLRERAAKGAILPDDVGEASLLIDGRASLLSDEDQAFLRAFRARPPPQADLESGREPAGGSPQGLVQTAQADPAAGNADPAVDRALLKAKLLTSVKVSGTRAERAEIDETIDALLQTRTGLALAREFVAEGMKATLAFGEVAGSTVVTQEGKKVLQASGGHTHTDRDPPGVVLNRHYLLTDEGYRRAEMVETLGHELFGHAFETQRAEKAGLGYESYYFYRGDETLAGLIGWALAVENGKGLEYFASTYLDDPEKYYAELITNQPYYATILSPAEMKDPVAAVTKRLGETAKARAALADGEKTMRGWKPIVAHFKTVHGIPAARFSVIDEEIANYATFAVGHRATLSRIEAHMKSTLARWRTPAGKAEVARMRVDADSPHLAAFERRLAARAAELRALVLSIPKKPTPISRDPASSETAKAAPTVPPLTFAELGEMLDKDRTENPKHWETKKTK